MKHKLISITVFFDKSSFNPYEAKKRLGPPTERVVMAQVKEWRALGCIVCVNKMKVDAERLSRYPRFDNSSDEWVTITFVSLPLDEPDDITVELV